MTRFTQRFEEVVRRKTDEAASSELSPLRTVEAGVTESLQAIGNGWTREKFDGDFFLTPPGRDLPSTSLVFVQSSDGNTGARNPSVLGGGLTDKHLIYEGLSRVAADGVLAGAETIRGSSVIFSVWHPELVELRRALHLPRHPTQIVATLGRLTFDDTLLLNVPELPVIVVTTPDWITRMRDELSRRPWITSIPMDRPDDLPAAFRAMRALGMARISAIGGRTIARAMTAAGLIQDLYLTTSPIPGGDPGTPLYAAPIEGTLIVRKRGTGDEDGVAFEHLVI